MFLKKCGKCVKYTLREKCPKCGKEVQSVSYKFKPSWFRKSL